MWKTALACTALLVSSAYGFEIKGISPGDDASSISLKGCRQVANADSGVPGYTCDTTFAGSPAKMTILVAENKVIGILITVDHEVMQPTLQALEEKYGHAARPNQFMQRYVWSSGRDYMTIEERRAGAGYSVSNVNLELFEAFTKQKAQKAKGDL